MKRVSVIIPHYNGIDILRACLESLARSSYPDLEIVLVDNASTDGSADFVRQQFPAVRIVQNEVNEGFAGGCNRGIEQASGDYLLILNNDTTHNPDWIDHMVAVLEQDENIAAVQPKIMSAQDPSHFDYAGGAGGYIDLLGFPYALGRIFTTLEKDEGQYDDPREIFWASGTAFLVRREALDQVGTFDEDFFAHMEEIDLCWRLLNAGWRILSAPQAVIQHHSGWTLPPDRYLKKYLNHRNNLVMIIKNTPFAYLAFTLPARIALEGVAFVFSALIRDWKRMAAILHSLGWNLFHPWLLLRKHLAARRQRVPQAVTRTMRRMEPGSIFFQYFLCRRRVASAIRQRRSES